MSKFVRLESGTIVNVDNINLIRERILTKDYCNDIRKKSYSLFMNAVDDGQLDDDGEFTDVARSFQVKATKKDVDNIMKATNSSESSKPVLSKEILETVLTLIDAERYNLGGQLGAVENSGAPHEVIESERCQILDEDASLKDAEDELRYLYEQQGGHWESPSIKRASKAYGWDD